MAIESQYQNFNFSLLDLGLVGEDRDGPRMESSAVIQLLNLLIRNMETIKNSSHMKNSKDFLTLERPESKKQNNRYRNYR